MSHTDELEEYDAEELYTSPAYHDRLGTSHGSHV